MNNYIEYSYLETSNNIPKLDVEDIPNHYIRTESHCLEFNCLEISHAI